MPSGPRFTNSPPWSRVRKTWPRGHRYRCDRSEEHTSELQSHHDLVCRLLLETKKLASRHIPVIDPMPQTTIFFVASAKYIQSTKRYESFRQISSPLHPLSRIYSSRTLLTSAY